MGALRRSRPTLFSKRCRGGAALPLLFSPQRRSAERGRAAAITPCLVFKALPRKHDPVSFLHFPPSSTRALIDARTAVHATAHPHGRLTCDGSACGVFGRAFSPRDRVVATTQPAGLGCHGPGLWPLRVPTIQPVGLGWEGWVGMGRAFGPYECQPPSPLGLVGMAGLSWAAPLAVKSASVFSETFGQIWRWDRVRRFRPGLQPS